MKAFFALLVFLNCSLLLSCRTDLREDRAQRIRPVCAIQRAKLISHKPRPVICDNPVTLCWPAWNRILHHLRHPRSNFNPYDYLVQ